MIAERLKSLRKELNFSKRQLVSAIPINYSTYANYESGFREPNSEVLQVLANYFDVSLDYLLGVSENRQKADEIAILTDEEHAHIMEYRKVDQHAKELIALILGKEKERVEAAARTAPPVEESKEWIALRVFTQRASTGLGNYLHDIQKNANNINIDEYDTMRFMKTPISQRADFCVRIMGESMEPKICDGDIVFVKTVPRVDVDDVGIFVYEGEAFCKRLRLDAKRNMLFLESLNKSYAPRDIRNPEDLRTVGLVIGLAEKV